MPDNLARSNTNPTARTVGPMFLFPNRYLVFERIYGVLASSKGIAHAGPATPARPNTNPPARTVGPMFLFPNRYIVFERIYGVLASCKGLPPVGTANSHRYADFPHLQVSDAVVNGDAIDIGPLAAAFSSDLPEYSDRHRFIGWIF